MKFFSISFVFGLSLLFFSNFDVAQAYITNATFWKRHSSSLKFTTTAQSILASNCSGIATVATYNPGGVLTNVLADLTVSLTGPGTTTFYSDAYCSTAITTATITTGTNSASFYFIDTSTGSVTLAASGTGYAVGNQTETLAANPFIWMGGGGNANWSTGANWSGGAAPGTSNVALFNGACSSNCSPNITASISIGGIRIVSAYAGTITQNAASNITIGTAKWYQNGGTFAGSTSTGTITLNGDFRLTGGSFQATKDTMTFNPVGSSSSFYVGASVTFLSNSGTINFASPGYTFATITPGTVSYNNVSFSGYVSGYTLNGATMTIAGNFSRSGTNVYVNSATLAIGGDVTVDGNYVDQTTVIRLTGRAAGQTITSTNGGVINGLVIDTGTNPVTFSGTVYLANNYTVTSVGTATMTGSLLYFRGLGYSTASIQPGTIAYNNVQFAPYSGNFDFGGGTMTINGNLTFGSGAFNYNDSGSFDNGTLNVTGNVTTTASKATVGSALVRMVGNASGQTITATGTSNAGVPNLEIAAGSNNVTMSGSVIIAGNYTLTSVNTLTTTGSTLYFSVDDNNVTINPGTAIYNNVQLYPTWMGTNYDLNGSTFNIAGSLSVFGGGQATRVNSGTISLGGNLSTAGSASNGGTAAINFVGSSAQTITSDGSPFPTGNITVNTSSGAVVSLASAVSFNGASQTFTINGGSVDQAGYNLTLHALSLNAHTITRNGGSLTVNGSAVAAGMQSVYGGTVAP